MNKFLAFLLIVSVFVLNAFCMNPSSFGPDPPANVEFEDCFFVPMITGKTLLAAVLYNYRHICQEKFTDNGSQLPAQEKYWYFVGRLKDLETLSEDRPKFDYVPIKQSLIQLVYLEGTNVEWVSRSTDERFAIKFQSIQQRNTFYKIIYHDVNMYKAAPYKIGMLHEMIAQENIKFGDNVEALQEEGNYGKRYITFRNNKGEPLLIFGQNQAAIMRISRVQDDKHQLLMRIHGVFYILTFSDGAYAKIFSASLLQYVNLLKIWRVDANVRARFETNRITMDPKDVL